MDMRSVLVVLVATALTFAMPTSGSRHPTDRVLVLNSTLGMGEAQEASFNSSLAFLGSRNASAFHFNLTVNVSVSAQSSNIESLAVSFMLPENVQNSTNGSGSFSARVAYPISTKAAIDSESFVFELIGADAIVSRWSLDTIREVLQSSELSIVATFHDIPTEYSLAVSGVGIQASATPALYAAIEFSSPKSFGAALSPNPCTALNMTLPVVTTHEINDAITNQTGMQTSRTYFTGAYYDGSDKSCSFCFVAAAGYIPPCNSANPLFADKSQFRWSASFGECTPTQDAAYFPHAMFYKYQVHHDGNASWIWSDNASSTVTADGIVCAADPASPEFAPRHVQLYSSPSPPRIGLTMSKTASMTLGSPTQSLPKTDSLPATRTPDPADPTPTEGSTSTASISHETTHTAAESGTPSRSATPSHPPTLSVSMPLEPTPSNTGMTNTNIGTASRSPSMSPTKTLVNSSGGSAAANDGPPRIAEAPLPLADAVRWLSLVVSVLGMSPVAPSPAMASQAALLSAISGSGFCSWDSTQDADGVPLSLFRWASGDAAGQYSRGCLATHYLVGIVAVGVILAAHLTVAAVPFGEAVRRLPGVFAPFGLALTPGFASCAVSLLVSGARAKNGGDIFFALFTMLSVGAAVGCTALPLLTSRFAASSDFVAVPNPAVAFLVGRRRWKSTNRTTSASSETIPFCQHFAGLFIDYDIRGWFLVDATFVCLVSVLAGIRSSKVGECSVIHAIITALLALRMGLVIKLSPHVAIVPRIVTILCDGTAIVVAILLFGAHFVDPVDDTVIYGAIVLLLLAVNLCLIIAVLQFGVVMKGMAIPVDLSPATAEDELAKPMMSTSAAAAPPHQDSGSDPFGGPEAHSSTTQHTLEVPEATTEVPTSPQPPLGDGTNETPLAIDSPVPPSSKRPSSVIENSPPQPTAEEDDDDIL